MPLRHAFGLLLLLAPILPAHADEPLPPDAPSVTLDTVLVSGARTGPGLWQVREGDHVMWVLGTQSPLPKRMDWLSDEVERTVAASQEVIDYPGVEFDAGIGPVRGLFLLPSLFKARRNPEEQTLQDVLPPALYARWTVLKKKYMPRRNKVEEWRPIFAAGELYSEAIEESGLSHKDRVWPIVRKAAKKHDVPITSSEVAVEIEAPRDAIKEFTATGIDDIACFERTLDRLETDLGAMKARANAWADGNLEALRALPYPDQNAACREAILAATVSQKNGLQDLPQRVRTLWIETADKALKKNTSTFAVLPIVRMYGDDGYFSGLEALGYEVVAPDEADAEAEDDEPVEAAGAPDVADVDAPMTPR